MFNTGYPVSRFSIKDNSGASTNVLFSPQEDGLCVPFSFIMAERGVPGAIYYGGAKELTAVLGDATFDVSSPYFNASTQYTGFAMAGQGVEVMRLVDPAATTADIGIFLSVTPKDVVQYKKNADGSRMLDGSGNPIPKLMADGVTVVTEPGVLLKWTTRGLTNSEDFASIPVATVTNNGVVTTTYPIVAGKVLSPGKYGDRQGIMLYSTAALDSTIAQDINSVLYRFVPMELPTDVSTTASPMNDIFGASFADVSFKDVAIYSATNNNYGFNFVLGNNYVDKDSGNTTLPYDLHAYGANVKTVGQAVLAVSPELGSIDPYLVDLIAVVDGNGNHYDHVELDSASSTVVNSSVVNYATGGSDGDTSWTMFESLVANWLSGNDHGEFTNLQQHPMTHFYDPGFSMATKYLLFNMLDLRDNFKVDVVTQDITKPLNTKAQDIAAGQALAFRAQMHPESVINGVGCHRVGIYAHAAPLVNGSPYGGNIPFNLNRLIQRRDFDGGTTIRGSIGGFPNNEVTLFRKPAWVADDEKSQSLSWANCINVVRHATRTRIFYPSIRTVYPNDTSLLSDDEISDRIIYMYKICRFVWAKYAGVRKAPEKLYPLIQDDIANMCEAAFGGDDVRVKPTVFQTAQDANLGTQISVNLAFTGALPLRGMNFNVAVGRVDPQ